MLSYDKVKHILKEDGEWVENYVEGSCLSTDSKPTEGIANGSIIKEMDTATLYLFDKAGATWRAWE